MSGELTTHHHASLHAQLKDKLRTVPDQAGAFVTISLSVASRRLSSPAAARRPAPG